ncbi:protein mono-ADP-ribosyltransferase PARP16-like [Sphaerodactylus townsendi]|uniref:protein mono-ADP-ribosyltransferase PARP16-like n=1 Tax=Sphaerodactylus townsendi TaxID=933632 RepID=UPI002026F836|nr:protein mono-ADP-ribosyltransferase PARP16-like [Sphaerodactylus townsendi]
MPASRVEEEHSRIKEALQMDLLAADLKCSFFVSALQNYKRDSALRPFPSFYFTEETKDFEALLADTNSLVSLRELLPHAQNTPQRTWELLDWILSSRALTIHSMNKNQVRVNVAMQFIQ